MLRDKILEKHFFDHAFSSTLKWTVKFWLLTRVYSPTFPWFCCLADSREYSWGSGRLSGKYVARFR